ncbi:MAG: hypothetical protein ABH879_08285 [archaeon]
MEKCGCRKALLEIRGMLKDIDLKLNHIIEQNKEARYMQHGHA